MLRYLRKRLGMELPVPEPLPFLAPLRFPGLVYAIGDIHGCRDLAETLCTRIVEDAAGREATLVFMGDYVDRGEQVRETLDYLIGFAAGAGGGLETVFLMGNHEQMLLQFLRDPKTGKNWFASGGLQTLMSYGIGPVGNLRDPEQADRLRAGLATAMGGHLEFIQGLRLSWRAGNVFFAHAGADPALPIDEQEVSTLLWGTRRMMAAPRQDGIWVVYGHYITDEPTAEAGRIAIDTGAYVTNRLTAVRIEGGEVAFMQA